MAEQHIVVLSMDLETTGLSTVTSEITQIGIAIEHWVVGNDDTGEQKILSCTTLSPFCEYVRCVQTEEFNARVIEVTGITQATLVNAKPMEKVAMRMLEHIDAVCKTTKHLQSATRILTTYNGDNYDLPIFVAELARHVPDPMSYLRSLKLSFNIDALPCGRKCLDTTTLLRTTTGRASYRLGDVYKSLIGKPLSGAHDALVDAKAVLECLAHEQFREALLPDLVCSSIGNCVYLSNPMIILKKCYDKHIAHVQSLAELKNSGDQTIAEMVNSFKKKNKKRKRTAVPEPLSIVPEPLSIVPETPLL